MDDGDDGGGPPTDAPSTPSNPPAPTAANTSNMAPERATPGASDVKSTAVRVMGRFRPLNAAEQRKAAGAASCVRLEGKCVVHHTSLQDGSEYPYSFDRIFGPSATQAEIYEIAAAPIVDAVLQGYNGTVFAYGQTSSGKTFTMTGLPERPDFFEHETKGIIPRAVTALFDGIAAADEDTEFTLSVQYVEIYKERVRDLLYVKEPSSASSSSRVSFGGAGAGADHLDPNSYRLNLKIVMDANGVPGVPGAAKEYVGEEAEIFALLQAGNANRETSTTNMNAVSSRSVSDTAHIRTLTHIQQL